MAKIIFIILFIMIPVQTLFSQNSSSSRKALLGVVQLKAPIKECFLVGWHLAGAFIFGGIALALSRKIPDFFDNNNINNSLNRELGFFGLSTKAAGLASATHFYKIYDQTGACLNVYFFNPDTEFVNSLN